AGRLSLPFRGARPVRASGVGRGAGADAPRGGQVGYLLHLSGNDALVHRHEHPRHLQCRSRRSSVGAHHRFPERAASESTRWPIVALCRAIRGGTQKDMLWRTSLWKQFAAAIDMLANALVACPDSLWREHVWPDPSAPSQRTEFWYVSYHALV